MTRRGEKQLDSETVPLLVRKVISRGRRFRIIKPTENNKKGDVTPREPSPLQNSLDGSIWLDYFMAYVAGATFLILGSLAPVV